MANYYAKLDVASNGSMAASLKAALLAKYGDDGVTIHYDGDNLIFTCPAISDFVIKVMRDESHYGTSYSGGSSVANDICFYNGYNFITDAHLVLGDSFLFMTGVNGAFRFVIIVAKTIGGRSVVSGCSTKDTYIGKCVTKDLTSDQKINFLDFGNTAVFCNTNTPYKTKLVMAYETNGDQLVRNADGSIDTIDGLYMSTYSNKADGNYRAVSNALLSARNVYSNELIERFASSVIAEF